MIEVKDLLSLVGKKLPKKRFLHSVSVASTAEFLSLRFSLPLYSGYITGLFHDYYRYMDEEEALSLAKKMPFPVFREELESPLLLHGPIAAMNMERVIGSVPEEYMKAVRFHTLGSKDMGKLGAVLFIADYAEPLRTHLTSEERKELLSSDTLEEIVLRILRLQDSYFMSIGRKNAEVTEELKKFLESGGVFS